MGERNTIFWLDSAIREANKPLEYLLVVPIRGVAKLRQQWSVKGSSPLDKAVNARLVEDVDLVVPDRAVRFLHDAVQATREFGKQRF